MNMKKRLISVAVIVAVVAFLCIFGRFFATTDGQELPLGLSRKETLQLWYTDDALTDYLNSKAVSFYEANDIRVETKLVSGLEYLETISRASVHQEGNAPDLFIVTNDSLEKAYLSGLATEIKDFEVLTKEENYSSAAQNSVLYKGKYLGYPLYFETGALLYNKTYLEQIAADAVNTAEDSEEEPVSAEDLIPGSIADILAVADKYSAPEDVEYFFRWDVSDIFYNYFFIGNYISVGGPSGENKEQIDIYNEDAIASLSVYQELNQFFSIDTKETNYDTIMQEFLNGKTIYTIATSDCIKKLEAAKESGEFTYEFGIAEVPDINQELETKGMSVTNALVVNGYSKHKESAELFAEYLINEDGNELYQMTGKLPARIQKQYSNEHMAGFVQNYAKSAPIPKMVETSNFWVELEICFAKVWDGADANTELKTLSEQIKSQLAGESVTEEMLETPVVELLTEDGSEGGD